MVLLHIPVLLIGIHHLSFSTGCLQRDLSRPRKTPRFEDKMASFRNFEKGLAGGGWRPAGPKKQPKCVPFLIRGLGKGWNLWHRKDLLAPTPSVRQPLFETSDSFDAKVPTKLGGDGNRDKWYHFRACAGEGWEEAVAAGHMACQNPPCTGNLRTWETSSTNVCRVINAMKLGVCSCRASGEKWREICYAKFWALPSFVY